MDAGPFAVATSPEHRVTGSLDSKQDGSGNGNGSSYQQSPFRSAANIFLNEQQQTNKSALATGTTTTTTTSSTSTHHPIDDEEESRHESYDCGILDPLLLRDCCFGYGSGYGAGTSIVISTSTICTTSPSSSSFRTGAAASSSSFDLTNGNAAPDNEEEEDVDNYSYRDSMSNWIQSFRIDQRAADEEGRGEQELAEMSDDDDDGGKSKNNNKALIKDEEDWMRELREQPADPDSIETLMDHDDDDNSIATEHAIEIEDLQLQPGISRDTTVVANNNSAKLLSPALRDASTAAATAATALALAHSTISEVQMHGIARMRADNNGVGEAELDDTDTDTDYDSDDDAVQGDTSMGDDDYSALTFPDEQVSGASSSSMRPNANVEHNNLSVMFAESESAVCARSVPICVDDFIEDEDDDDDSRATSTKSEDRTADLTEDMDGEDGSKGPKTNHADNLAASFVRKNSADSADSSVDSVASRAVVAALSQALLEFDKEHDAIDRHLVEETANNIDNTEVEDEDENASDLDLDERTLEDLDAGGFQYIDLDANNDGESRVSFEEIWASNHNVMAETSSSTINYPDYEKEAKTSELKEEVVACVGMSDVEKGDQSLALFDTDNAEPQDNATHASATIATESNKEAGLSATARMRSRSVETTKACGTAAAVFGTKAKVVGYSFANGVRSRSVETSNACRRKAASVSAKWTQERGQGVVRKTIKIAKSARNIVISQSQKAGKVLSEASQEAIETAMVVRKAVLSNRSDVKKATRASFAAAEATRVGTAIRGAGAKATSKTISAGGQIKHCARCCEDEGVAMAKIVGTVTGTILAKGDVKMAADHAISASKLSPSGLAIRTSSEKATERVITLRKGAKKCAGDAKRAADSIIIGAKLSPSGLVIRKGSEKATERVISAGEEVKKCIDDVKKATESKFASAKLSPAGLALRNNSEKATERVISAGKAGSATVSSKASTAGIAIRKGGEKAAHALSLNLRSQDPVITTHVTSNNMLHQDKQTLCRSRTEVITTKSRGTLLHGLWKNTEVQLMVEAFDVDANEILAEEEVAKARNKASHKAAELSSELEAARESEKFLYLRSKRITVGDDVVAEVDPSVGEDNVLEDSSDEEDTVLEYSKEKVEEDIEVNFNASGVDVDDVDDVDKCSSQESSDRASYDDIGKVHSTIDVQLCATCICTKCKFNNMKAKSLRFINNIKSHADCTRPDCTTTSHFDDVETNGMLTAHEADDSAELIAHETDSDSMEKVIKSESDEVQTSKELEETDKK